MSIYRRFTKNVKITRLAEFTGYEVKLTDILEFVDKTGFPEEELYMTVQEDYDCMDIVLLHKVEETDEEFEARHKREQNNREKAEREIYESLKKKFEEQ